MKNKNTQSRLSRIIGRAGFVHFTGRDFFW